MSDKGSKDISKMNKFEAELYMRENNVESVQEAKSDYIMDSVKAYITPAKELLNQRFTHILDSIQRRLNDMIINTTEKNEVFISAKGLPDKYINLIKNAVVAQGYDLLPAEEATSIYFEIPKKLFKDGGEVNEENNED